MPRRCSATGGASTGAASSAVSISLPLSWHSWGVTTARCWSTGDVPGSAGTRDAQGMAAARDVSVHHELGLTPASPHASWAWRCQRESLSPGKILSYLSSVGGVECASQSRAHHAFLLRLPPSQPSPQESKGSLGWKPGLSVAHAEEKAQWQSPVCTDLSSAGFLLVIPGLAAAEGTVTEPLP